MNLLSYSVLKQDVLRWLCASTFDLAGCQSLPARLSVTTSTVFHSIAENALQTRYHLSVFFNANALFKQSPLTGPVYGCPAWNGVRERSRK